MVLLGGLSSSFGGGDFGSVVGSRVFLGLNSGIVGFVGSIHNSVGMFPFSSSLSGSSIGGGEFSMSFFFSSGSGSSGIISVLSGILGSEVFFGLLFTDLLEVLVLRHVVGLVVLEYFMSSSGFERGFEIHSRAIIDDGCGLGVGGFRLCGLGCGGIFNMGCGLGFGGINNGCGLGDDGSGSRCGHHGVTNNGCVGKSNSLRNGSKSNSGKYGVHFVGIVFVLFYIIN